MLVHMCYFRSVRSACKVVGAASRSVPPPCPTPQPPDEPSKPRSRVPGGLSRSLSRSERSRRRSRPDDCRRRSGDFAPPDCEGRYPGEAATTVGARVEVIPGRGSIGHYGLWRQMWRTQTAKEQPAPHAASNTTTIIGKQQ